MRYSFILGAVTPLALACDSTANDACHSALVASSASAASFCSTYTQSTKTATTGFPTFASACSLKHKKISSACSCLNGDTVVATTLATVTKSNSTIAPAIVSSASANVTNAINKKASTKITSSSTKAKSSTASASPVSVASSSIAAATRSYGSGSGSSSGSSSGSGSYGPGDITYTAASAPAGCTATAYADIAGVVSSCTTMVLSGISMPASSTLDLTSLATGAVVIFAGETTFGTTVNSDFDPIVVEGSDITITGAEGHSINGNGEAYWDGEGSNGGTHKPDHFFVVKDVTNGVISNLNIINWPVHCFDVTGCDTLEITGLTLNNTAGDSPNSASGTKAAAHNSDGFDFSSSNNVVLSNTAVYNQDDCVAVTSGTNITVTGMYCSGGHGLSIGSVGGKSNNVVDTIIFSDSYVINSENGCRIKSNANTTGSISTITYSNIVLSGISNYGIDVQQDYLNGGATSDPTNGVTISGVTFDSVTGTMSDGVDYYILCGSDSCSDFTFTDVSITGGSGDSCNFPTTGCPS